MNESGSRWSIRSAQRIRPQVVPPCDTTSGVCRPWEHVLPASATRLPERTDRLAVVAGVVGVPEVVVGQVFEHLA